MIWLSEELRAVFPQGLPMSQVFAIQGEIYRAPPGSGRETLRFERDGRGYFLKRHSGVGWREILKNLVSLKPPVLGAGNEWRAIRRLDQLGVASMPLLGYGQSGWNPAARRSFVITAELLNVVSLEDYCADWLRRPPEPRLKWRLIDAVARVARILHDNGINHRDLYICHILLERGSEPAPQLHLIDLHRVQIRTAVPRRWLVRDLGALWFSAMQIGLTRGDRMRFLRGYRQRPLREILAQEQDLWRRVDERAGQLLAKGNRG